MLKFASILTLVTLLIAVAIYNDRVNHSALSVQSFDLNHELIVELQPFPVQLEEQTQFVVRFTQDSQLTSAAIKEIWIEGVNMYMGKTSVFIEDSSTANMLQGWFFLGSCSQPKMHWRLFLKVDTERGQDILSFDFFTEV